MLVSGSLGRGINLDVPGILPKGLNQEMNLAMVSGSRVMIGAGSSFSRWRLQCKSRMHICVHDRSSEIPSISLRSFAAIL
jgi:hypothetical protein